MLNGRYGLPYQIFVVFLSLLIPCIGANASSSVDQLYYAGFALAGNAADAEANFPVTYEVLQEEKSNGIPKLEEVLWESLAQTEKAELLSRDLIDHSAGQNALAIAFVIDWENVALEKLPETTKLVADLHGQILVFDFESKKVIASYPVATQLIDVVQGEPTPEYERELIKKLYSLEAGEGIFGAFASRYAGLELKRAYGNYLGVVDVILEQKALAILEQYNQSPETYQNHIAENFGKQLSKNLNIPFVPYSKGSAIGSKMVARFSNGLEYQFDLPQPDYRVHLTVRGFKKVPLDSNSVLTAWAYGSYLRVKITDFDDATTYLDAPFKYGAVKKVMNDTESLDDWTIYQESTFSLVDQLTQNLGAPDRNWINEWSGGRETYNQLVKLEQIIARLQ